MRAPSFDLERELAEQQDSDHIFGSASEYCLAMIPPSERLKYLPQGELQRGKDDFQDCATRSQVENFEAKFNYLYANGLLTADEVEFFKKYGYIQAGRITFSDRFIAIKSGTTEKGNSLKAPLQAIHEHGLIPKKMLPAGNLKWKEYHDPKCITPEMEEVGKLLLSRFSLWYERVMRNEFPSVIDEEMIGVAGHAWPKPINGEYPVTDEPIQHAFLYVQDPRYNIRDSYPEGPDDYMKKLAPGYKLLDYGYRVRIERNEVAIERSIVDKLVLALKRGLDVFAIIKKYVGSWLS